MFLEASDITIGYGDYAVQRNLTCNLSSGTMVCLLGTNGSGKTTLLRTLAGMLPTLAGNITINGQSLSEMSSATRAKTLSIVLTDRLELQHTTVRQLITLGRIPYTAWHGTTTNIDREIVEQVIAQVGIEHLADKLSTQLSDGERQRVMIARALAQDTPLLLLDEPTSFLDLPNRIEIITLLKTLAHTTGKAIIISTHELDLALHTADQIWLMKKNSGIIADTPQKIIDNNLLNDAFPSKLFTFEQHNGEISLIYNISDVE